MSAKDLVRPIPGAQRLSRLRQSARFANSAHYWESNYAAGGTSGGGSYGYLAKSKADFINAFVCEHSVRSVVEFGCGDGHQLSLAEYQRYTGLDISRTAIQMCKRRFSADESKSFFLYDGDCFTDTSGIFAADLALSLDVIYHLVENDVFELYMDHLFSAGTRYVIAYSTDTDSGLSAPHVRHRCFTSWVEEHLPCWRLTQVVEGPNPEPAGADFFIFERIFSDE